MAQVAIASNVLSAGLNNTFMNIYNPMLQASSERVASITDLGIPSDKLTELYAYWESGAHPRRKPRGEEVSFKAPKDVGFNVTNFEVAQGISWYHTDREDDQLNKLSDRARAVGQNFALYPERVTYQILTGSTDNDLLDSIPNAPDGSALYATTAGGSARFGVTNGNLLTGTGVASVNTILNDYFSVISQYTLMQDTEGQPLWDPSQIAQGLVVVHGVGNEQAFSEAFDQSLHLRFRAGSSTTDVTTAVAGSNIIQDSGRKIKRISTPRITDNDWFCFMQASPHAPIFQQLRKGITESIFTKDNSDKARLSGEEGMQWESREGYGISFPQATVKVNN